MALHIDLVSIFNTSPLSHPVDTCMLTCGKNKDNTCNRGVRTCTCIHGWSKRTCRWPAWPLYASRPLGWGGDKLPPATCSAGYRRHGSWLNIKVRRFLQFNIAKAGVLWVSHVKSLAHMHIPVKTNEVCGPFDEIGAVALPNCIMNTGFKNSIPAWMHTIDIITV